MEGSECTWHGVTCDASEQHVTEIALGGNNFVGTLPGNLSDLAALRSFGAQGNDLSGSISALHGRSELWLFSVSENSLGGRIPPLTGLTQLQTLMLSYNRLSGAIPLLSDLDALQNFAAANSELTRDAPVVPSPSALLPFASTLCPNLVNPSTGSANDLAWGVATDLTPWSQGCTAAPLALAISDASLIEGKSGSTMMQFTDRHSGTPSATMSVNWNTTSGSATPGPDFKGGMGALSWSAGDASQRTLSIEFAGDTEIEPDENFTVNLQNALDATIADAIGEVTILNDDSSAERDRGCAVQLHCQRQRLARAHIR